MTQLLDGGPSEGGRVEAATGRVTKVERAGRMDKTFIVVIKDRTSPRIV